MTYIPQYLSWILRMILPYLWTEPVLVAARAQCCHCSARMTRRFDAILSVAQVSAFEESTQFRELWIACRYLVRRTQGSETSSLSTVRALIYGRRNFDEGPWVTRKNAED